MEYSWFSATLNSSAVQAGKSSTTALPCGTPSWCKDNSGNRNGNFGNNGNDKENSKSEDTVVLQIKRAANPQIILASQRVDEDFAPHYQETILHITGTKIPHAN